MKIGYQFSCAWGIEVENTFWRAREVQKEEARLIPLQ